MILFLNKYVSFIAVIKLAIGAKLRKISIAELVLTTVNLLVAILNVIISFDMSSLYTFIFMAFFIYVAKQNRLAPPSMNLALFICLMLASLQIQPYFPIYFEKSEFVILINILFLIYMQAYSRLLYVSLLFSINILLLLLIGSAVPILIMSLFIVISYLRSDWLFLIMVFLGVMFLPSLNLTSINLLVSFSILSEDLYRIYSNLVPFFCFEVLSLIGLWSEYKTCGTEFLQSVGLSQSIISKNFILQSGSPQGFIFRAFFDLGILGILYAIFLYLRVSRLLKRNGSTESQHTLSRCVFYIFMFVQHNLLFFPIFLLLFQDRGKSR